MKILQLLLIALIGIAVYANTFSNPFIWDDEHSVTTNTYIRHWQNIPKLFTHNFHPFAYRESIFYRPVTSLTLLFDYQLWKLNPFGYHLTNLLFHILSTWALYFLAFRLTLNRIVAFASGLIFVVHPVHTEAVTYISGRAEPITVLFVLLSILFFINSLKERSPAVNGLLTLFFLALALLSKEMAIITPFLFLLYEITFKPLQGRKILSFFQRYRYFLITGVLCAYLLARHFVVRSIPRPLPPPFPGIALVIAGGLNNIASYIRLLFFPLGLHMSRTETAIPGHTGVFLLVALFCVIIFAFFLKRFYLKDKVVFFGLAWFALGILPVSGIFSLNAAMAEHWLYLPSIGFILAISRIVVVSLKSGIFSRRWFKLVLSTIFISIVCSFGYLTVKRNLDWRDPIIFYEKTIKYDPTNSRLYFNLGNEYRLRNDWKEAEAAYKESARLNPDFGPAHNNLGNIYQIKGDKQSAIREYEAAITCDPNLASARDNLRRLLR